MEAKTSDEKTVIRLPFTVYRLSHRIESLKGLEVFAAYFLALFYICLRVDGLKGLDVGASCVVELLRQRQNIECEPSLIKLFKPPIDKSELGKERKVICHNFKPFKLFALCDARSTVHGYTDSGEMRHIELSKPLSASGFKLPAVLCLTKKPFTVYRLSHRMTNKVIRARSTGHGQRTTDSGEMSRQKLTANS